MSIRHTVQWVLSVGAACLAASPTITWAQVGRGGAGTVPNGSNLSAYANPFTNPTNPFLNPYMAQMTQPNMTPGNAALYFFAAQQAQGGIGSGQLSGVRPRGATAATPPARPAAAGTSMVPGGNASAYFNRGRRSAEGTAHYYNRQGRYFPKSGQ